MEVGKVRVKPKTKGIAALMHNPQATRCMPSEWQTDSFIWITSGQVYP